MSERMTSVWLPGNSDAGYAEWGRKTVPEMLAVIRERARRQITEAQAILDAPDEAFRVETYVGPYAMRNLEILQHGFDVVKAENKE